MNKLSLGESNTPLIRLFNLEKYLKWKGEKETGRKISQEYMPKNLVGRKYYKPDWK